MSGLTGNVRVGSRLKGPKSVADDEDAGTEATKAFRLDCRNGEESAETWDMAVSM